MIHDLNQTARAWVLGFDDLSLYIARAEPQFPDPHHMSGAILGRYVTAVELYLEKQLRDMVFVSISFFSTQIINRYVAEPSLCKDSMIFALPGSASRRLAEMMEHP